MKNYFTLLLLSLASTLLYSQTEPIEKVDFEPDPIMMDAYDFATGKMNDVKWMIRATLDNGPRLGFEYKLGNSFSVNVESSWLLSYIGSRNNSFLINNSFSIRYYLGHKDQILNGLKGNNLNGGYLEFGSSINVPVSFNITENAFVGIGLQSRFLKRGLIDTGLKLQYFSEQGALRLSTGFDLGLAFSKDYNLVEMEENKCAIVRCYDEQFYMFKIPISRFALFSLSKTITEIDLRPSFQLEHRISKVGLSMNHEIRGNVELLRNTNNDSLSYNYVEASYKMGIRWYVGKKKRIIKGKTSNNLSGFYLGPVGEIGKAGGSTGSVNVKYGEFYSIGFQSGFQTRLLKNLYINFHFGMMGRDYFNPEVYGIMELVELREESLIFEEDELLIEFIPFGGLIVGYSF